MPRPSSISASRALSLIPLTRTTFPLGRKTLKRTRGARAVAGKPGTPLPGKQLIEAAGQPYTIVRATHSFEVLRAIADSATDGRCRVTIKVWR